MTRTPVGTVQKPRSDTSLFAHVAWRLEGGQIKGMTRWIGDLGLNVGATAIRRAPLTADRLAGGSYRERAIRASATVDYAALKLFAALVTLRIARRSDAVLAELEQVRGVVELLVGENRKDLFAVVVYEHPEDKRAVEARLGEFAEVIDWQTIDERRVAAAAMTFRSLARDAAAREQLLL